MIKFSICICAYNSEKYISEALNSAIKQNYNNYEIIIVDDGSTDNTKQIIEYYRKKCGRIRYIYQQNTGLFHARITAFEHATGDFVICLDADDKLQHYALQEINNIIEKYNADIVIYRLNHFKNNKTYEVKQPYKEFENISKRKDFINKYIFTNELNSMCIKAIKKNLINTDAIKKFPRINIAEDWIHSYYPIQNAQSIYYFPKTLYNCRMSSNSMTSNYDYTGYDSFTKIFELQLDMLPNYRWINRNDVEIQYLNRIAKCIAYSHGQVKDKQKYINYVETIENNGDLKELYDKHKLGMKHFYRYVFDLMYRGKYDTLFTIKNISSDVRKFRK